MAGPPPQPPTPTPCMPSHLAHLPGNSGLAPSAPGNCPGRAGRGLAVAAGGNQAPGQLQGEWGKAQAWSAAHRVCQRHRAQRNCSVSQREEVWPPTGPTCSLPLSSHAPMHLSLQHFLEPLGLCLFSSVCWALSLSCLFSNHLASVGRWCRGSHTATALGEAFETQRLDLLGRK